MKYAYIPYIGVFAMFAAVKKKNQRYDCNSEANEVNIRQLFSPFKLHPKYIFTSYKVVWHTFLDRFKPISETFKNLTLIVSMLDKYNWHFIYIFNQILFNCATMFWLC